MTALSPESDDSTTVRVLTQAELLAFRDGAFRRSRVQFVTMICSGQPAHSHRFKRLLQSGLTDDGSFGSVYYQTAPDQWSPFVICPSADCNSFMDEERYASTSAQVRESDRYVAFISADGKRIAPPGLKDGPGFEQCRARRLALGYRMVEAKNFRDLDKFDAIRAEQTGNHVYHEMNFDPATRQFREDDESYDDTDMSRDY
jgi:hypothetical protein